MRSGAPDGRAYAKAVSWVVALAGALVGTAAAAPPPPPPPEDVPAVSAYVELVPTSRGSRSPRAGENESRTLPPAIEARITREGGSDAAGLKKVATSSAYGAPQARKGVTREAEVEPTDESSLGAAVTVVTDAGDDRLLALGLVLIALTAGAAAAAFFRRPRA